MRADRLVAVLLLLQVRGRVTAAEVAEELEVSERTARRDLEALGMAGVPVYPTRGRGGGWSLVGGARTDLTGLQADEVRALFFSLGSSAASTPALAAALRKLVQAMPETFRDDAAAAADTVLVDPAGWGRGRHGDEPEHLAALQAAVVAGERVILDYTAPGRAASRRRVDPLGLVTKASVWYLVAGTDAGRRTFRVDRVGGVEPTGEPVERPDGFELADAWRTVTDDFSSRFAAHEATASAEPWTLGPLSHLFGSALTVADMGPDGRHDIVVRAPSVEALAAELAGFTGAVEVTGPDEVRTRLRQIGAELTALYP